MEFSNEAKHAYCFFTVFQMLHSIFVLLPPVPREKLSNASKYAFPFVCDRLLYVIKKTVKTTKIASAVF